MGRPSNREEKRREILQAFAQVLADHGYAGATIAKVAAEAGIAPGLIHHHFKNKEELLSALLDMLMARFRSRLRQQDAQALGLAAYADAALKLDEKADTVAAKCWVGLLAEAVRNPDLFKRVRRMLDSEISNIQALSGNQMNDHDASAVLAFVMGSLVFGAFAPRKTAGFAAPALKRFVHGLNSH